MYAEKKVLAFVSFVSVNRVPVYQETVAFSKKEYMDNFMVSFYALLPSLKGTAVASNRPTEALASVISFTFFVYSHYKHS